MLQMYAAFGLATSLKKVSNFANMLLCAEYCMWHATEFAMEFSRGLTSIQDDMFQVKSLKVQANLMCLCAIPNSPVKLLI